jgi:hypothetical protein
VTQIAHVRRLGKKEDGSRFNCRSFTYRDKRRVNDRFERRPFGKGRVHGEITEERRQVFFHQTVFLRPMTVYEISAGPVTTVPMTWM